MPTCSRERETAAHSTGSAGISTIGVGRVSVTGGIVGEGTIVGVPVAVGGSEVGDDVGESVGGIVVSVGARVSVGGRDVEETIATVSVGGSGVEVASEGVDDPVLPFQSKKRKRRIRMMVTINLKRS